MFLLGFVLVSYVFMLVSYVFIGFCVSFVMLGAEFQRPKLFLVYITSISK